MSYPEKIHQDFNECPHGRHRENCPECESGDTKDELIIAMRKGADLRVEVKRLTLRWTKEKPTAPGWYWMQSKTQSATIVRVDTDADDNLCVDGLEDFDCGQAWQDDLGTMAGAEWAGPIPEPGET